MRTWHQVIKHKKVVTFKELEDHDYTRDFPELKK